jgi:hypothetical protein
MSAADPETDSVQDASPRSWWVAAIPILAWALMSLPAFLVQPSGDDWSTSSPLYALQWGAVRPQIMWRPFEPLLRWLVGLAPGVLYPSAPHALAIAGHAMSGWFAYRLLREARVSSRSASLATAVALILPGAGAAAWSVDSAIQTWSSGCGLWAVFLLMTSRQRRWPAAWLAPAFLSMMWKESGTAWPVAAPLLAALLGSWTRPMDWRQTLRALGLGLGLLACYLVLRTTLAQASGLGAVAGRYSLSLSPLVLGKNLGQLGVVALLPVDTVALLGQPKNLGLAVVTALLGVPMLVLGASAWARLVTVPRAFLETAVMLLVAGPHLVLGHVSEMYAHPLILTATLVFTPALCQPSGRRSLLVAAVLCTFLGSLVSDVHKLAVMIATGHGAHHVGLAIAAEHPQPPRLMCAVQPATVQPGYSVFQMSAGLASGWGASALQAWGWPSQTGFVQANSALDCWSKGADLTVVFAPDSTFRLLNSSAERLENLR